MQNLVTLADYFLPRLCASCNAKLSGMEFVICTSCFAGLETATDERLSFEFTKKFDNSKIINDFTSAFVFYKDSPLQKLIHSLKYSKRYQNGYFLGKLIFKIRNEKLKEWNADYILPIPLHHLKKADRGFNQSVFIAKGLSKNCGIKNLNSVLKRIKFTETQTTLSLLERKSNMENAFKVNNPKIIKGKTIILIDDVITTGATISECGEELLKIGAKKIYAASAAIAD